MFTFSKGAAQRVMRAVLAIERLTGKAPQAKGPRGGGGRFPGIAKVRGVKTTGLNSDPSKPYVVVYFATNTASEQTGPEPNPMPDGEEWYLKSETYGEIHVPRVG